MKGHEDRARYLVEEYRFMRSFGMDHKAACRAIRIHPDTLKRLCDRYGLELTR